MLLAHIADPHLGYRAYHRLAPGGINARERDVALAFRAALDRTIELRADLVLVAGDVFHTVRPSNAAIADAFRQFARLRVALPDAPVVVVAGNHDSPRSVETGSILRLLREIPGIAVVDDEARAVHLDSIGASVLCLPHNALMGEQRIALEPDPDAAVNVLMLHGTISGGRAEEKLRYVSEYGGAKVDTSEIVPERWDYVALGHYHIATELAPNMWYAGGTERTSTNIWEEAETTKGFLTYDTEARKATFHPLPSRPVLDLPRFSARRARDKFFAAEDAESAEERGDERHEPLPPSAASAVDPDSASMAAAAVDPGQDGAGTPAPPRGKYLSPAEVDARIRERVEAVPGGIEGKIVRLVVEDVPRELFRELDHERIREYRAQALHFHLDVRRPEVRRVVGYGTPGRRRTLEEEVEGFLKRHFEPNTDGVERERLIALAKQYLTRAGKGEPEDALVGAETLD